MRQVRITNDVEAQLLAVLLETVKLVQDSLRLVVLIIIKHRIDLGGLGHDFGRIEA